MGRISKAVEARELENAVNWRFSIDNIIAANDKVVSAMDRMELPRIYRNSTTALHTSSDGQKFEVRQPSLNASYSFNYFGQLESGDDLLRLIVTIKLKEATASSILAA